MANHKPNSWKPFRPDNKRLQEIADDVSEVADIQHRLLDNHEDLHLPDRVAHQYQIAGSKVVFRVAGDIPAELQGVGLFEPDQEHLGIGRISTGLGTPHHESSPDFLGLMAAFQTSDGQRVDFLGINDPAAPTDNHRDFVDVLHATAKSAGAEIPFIPGGDFVAEQAVFATALNARMGLLNAGKSLAHIGMQTLRTFHSSTAFQSYWTGIAEVNDTAGKFVFVPTRDENAHPGLLPGKHHLSDDWKKRQSEGDVDFLLYWIAFLSEEETPTQRLTDPWKEANNQLVGTVTFPKTDADSEEARLWAILASEMGANPGNWVHDKENSIKQPATEFGVARKAAYQMSQEGRNVLAPDLYQSIFQSGEITKKLAQELKQRRDEKGKRSHVSWAT